MRLQCMRWSILSQKYEYSSIITWNTEIPPQVMVKSHIEETCNYILYAIRIFCLIKSREYYFDYLTHY